MGKPPSFLKGVRVEASGANLGVNSNSAAFILDSLGKFFDFLDRFAGSPMDRAWETVVFPFQAH